MTIINKETNKIMNSLGRAQKHNNIAGIINTRLSYQSTQALLNRDLGIYNLESINNLKSIHFLHDYSGWPKDKQRHFKITIGGNVNELSTTKFINQLLKDYKIVKKEEFKGFKDTKKEEKLV